MKLSPVEIAAQKTLERLYKKNAGKIQSALFVITQQIVHATLQSTSNLAVTQERAAKVEGLELIMADAVRDLLKLKHCKPAARAQLIEDLVANLAKQLPADNEAELSKE